MCGRNMQVLPVINKSTIRALSQTGFGLALRDSASSDDKIRGGGEMRASHRCRDYDGNTSTQASDETSPVNIC
jgi:hypothetical protein